MSGSPRKGALVALIVGVPLLFGIGLIALANLERTGEEGPPPSTALQEAPAPVQAGPHAPRVKLTDARSGGTFDSDAAEAPYGVAFISTRCAQLADPLRRTARELRRDGSPALVLLISATPGTDTRAQARAWLTRHGEPTNVHFLVGSEAELRRYWSAWGFAPTAADGGDCEGIVPVHLVSGGGANAGVIDVDPANPGAELTAAFLGIPG